MGFVNINTLSIGGVLIFILYKTLQNRQKPELRTREGLPVPIGVGRERSFVNKTGDAGLYIDQIRKRREGYNLIVE